MKKKPFDYGCNPRNRYFAAFVAVCSILFLSFALFMLSKKSTNIKLVSMQSASTYIQADEEGLKVELKKVGDDLDYIQELMGKYTPFISKKQLLEADIALFAKTHPYYRQIRMLDLTGHEMIRTSTDEDGHVYVTPPAELQDKSLRYYFQAAKKMGDEQTYISGLDLNIEHGKIEHPYKPMIRFVKVVKDKENNRMGYCVLNYSGKEILSALKKDKAPVGTLLLNREGYYLIGFTAQEEWGFMTGDSNKTFGSRFPQAWDYIRDTPKGSLENDAYQFTFAHFYPDRYVGHALKNPDHDWVIVNYCSKEVFDEQLKHYLKDLVILLAPYYVLSLVISWLVATYIVQLMRAKVRIKIAYQAFEHASEGIIVMDPDARIIQVNNGFRLITGYTEAEVLGKHIAMIHNHKQDQEEIYAQMWKTLRECGEWNGELWNMRKDGSRFLESISVSAVQDERGKTLFYIAIFLEITKYKEQEEQLRRQIVVNEEQHHKLMRQSRMAQMGEMLSMIAHQWRQPLASISAITGTLSIKAMTDEYSREFFLERLDAITDIAQHLSMTIDDFRGFFREDKQKSTITLEALVQHPLRIIEPSLETKHIQVEQQWETTEEVETYPNELRQVILNLLKNAEDAIMEQKPSKPRIRIRGYRENGWLCLEICDNAGGVPEAYKDQIFDPYFSTKMQKDGTGLGLYMSKIIVEEHCRGELKLENAIEGACFTIRLPESHPEAPAAEEIEDDLLYNIEKKDENGSE